MTLNPNLIMNAQLAEVAERLNEEILRRGTFSWWDPLTIPAVGKDRTPPLNLPCEDENDERMRQRVSEETYTINNPSKNSIEPTRNTRFPAHGMNPASEPLNRRTGDPRTSANRWDVDEARNFLVGLAKMRDINLYYGRDEQAWLAFRDPSDIGLALAEAQASELNAPLLESSVPNRVRPDPNNGITNKRYEGYGPYPDVDTGVTVEFPLLDGAAVMHSGEFDGEEGTPNKNNFYDDTGVSRTPSLVVPPESIVDMRIHNEDRLGSIFDIINIRSTGDWDFNNTENGDLVDRNVEMSSLIVDGETIIPNGTTIRVRFEYGIMVHWVRINVNSIGPVNLMHNGERFRFIHRDENGNDITIPSVGALWNPFISERVDRSHRNHDHNRNPATIHVEEGGIPSSPRFGQNPRNPNMGNQYAPRPVFGGVIGICNVACTGLCYQTCDNECSETCTTTCWNRCGNACTATCGNICTGCNTMCYTACKTKCSNQSGLACLNVGAKAVRITRTGARMGDSGPPNGGNWPSNSISFTTYSCHGCSFTCQFWPNKRTTCTDAACEGNCFTLCTESCSASCFGGCIDNPTQNTDISGTFKTGIGRACSDGCVMNCIGTCQGVCEGECIQTCWHACKSQCADNCTWKCWTNCGHGCTNGCTNGCTGCSSCTGTCEGTALSGTNCNGTCEGICEDTSTARYCEGNCQGLVMKRGCVGCGMEGGCSLECRHGCNHNCLGDGCRVICGIGPAQSCSANCRINCMGSSCTSLCSNACSSQCTTCANHCGFQCGPCSSQCSTECGHECNITCVEKCANSCDNNCVTNCTDDCGGCSDLCYSCVGMCIGTCSVKCQDGCSNCANQCGWWCDVACNRACFNNCDDRCLMSCVGSCISFLASETGSVLPGPYRPPTAEGYHTPFPSNRDEERESFRFQTQDVIATPTDPLPQAHIWIDEETEVEIEIVHCDYHPRNYILGEDGEPIDEPITVTVRCNRVVVNIADGILYTVYSTVLIAGVWTVIEEIGEHFYISDATVEDLESEYGEVFQNVDGGKGIILVVIHQNHDIVTIDPARVRAHLPIGLTNQPPIGFTDDNGDDHIVVIIQREEYDND